MRDLPLARVALGLTLLLSAGSLTACTYFNAEEAITPRPELLTAEEAGGGEQTPIGSGDLPAAADCGPDGTSYYPDPEETRYGVQYISGGRRIVLEAWDHLNGGFDFAPPLIDQLARSDYCRMGKAYWGENAATHSTDWRVTPLDFGDGIAAFQAVYWSGRDSVPPEPVLEEGLFVRTVARAYGIVDGTYIMVRIDLKNVSVEPPSEEELRALWDAQVAKVRYFKALERSKELLTPQSGQVN